MEFLTIREQPLTKTTVNLETRKFCRECGAKLSHICPQCGYENLTEDKFCGDCGHALANSEADHPIDYSQPQSYTPKILADKIITMRGYIWTAASRY